MSTLYRLWISWTISYPEIGFSSIERITGSSIFFTTSSSVAWGTTESDSAGNVGWAKEMVVSLPVDMMIFDDAFREQSRYGYGRDLPYSGR